MLHPDDLPFDHVPDVFTHFRRAVERDASIRAPWPAPDVVAGPDLDPGEIPTLAGLRLRLPARDPRTAVPLRGGETEARARLDHYLWESDHVARYHHTRNGLIGVDYSTKFSPYLAQGSISARRIHDEVRRYEAERTANRSTYWVIFELLWRDFFRLTAEQHGNALFRREGLRGERRAWRHDRELLERWIDGRTGDSFVDANMRELAATGYMSNRGRQNVASHLAHDLGVDWTWGAEWFESVLIDYDVHSNWGNWAYVAGVGNDPRVGRRFDTARQAAKYDPDGGYVRLWTERARP
jgi:deoxyribodipyrimidine photo-lyase